MSASSGMRGSCQVCGHQNNEHRTAPCPAPRCRNRWKRCQVTGGCTRNVTNWSYRMCFACKEHPAARDRLDFYGRQKDVTRAQKQNYRDTGDAGGDTSGGYSSSSSSQAASSPAAGTAYGYSRGSSAGGRMSSSRDSDRYGARGVDSAHHYPKGGSAGGHRSVGGGGSSGRVYGGRY